MLVSGVDDGLGPSRGLRYTVGARKSEARIFNAQDRPRLRARASRGVALRGIVVNPEVGHVRDEADEIGAAAGPAPPDVDLWNIVPAFFYPCRDPLKVEFDVL